MPLVQTRKPVMDVGRFDDTPPDTNVAIADAAERRLRGSSYNAVRHVKCEFREGILTLHGSVPSYYLKQIAQTLVCDTEGIAEVRNWLHVSWS